jgi:hypothetical protein
MSPTRHRMSPFGQQKRHADIRHNGLSPHGSRTSRTSSSFSAGSLSLRDYHAFFLAHSNTSGKQANDGVPTPASFIMDSRHPEWLPQRAAQPISSADSGERSVAARWLWSAPGLSSGRFVVADAAIYTVIGRILEIPHQSTGGVF